MCLAVILARKGSKRIKNKNIKNFYGKPVIFYSIKNAIKSSIFKKIIVSTDSIKIKKISEQFGAEVPYLRSKKNSSDYATTADVLFEILNKIKYNYNYVCVIYASSPLIDSNDIIKSYKLIKTNNYDSVIPVVKYSYNIWRSLSIRKDKIHWNFPQYELKRSQDLNDSYHDTGQFYFLSVKKFLRDRKIFMKNSYPLIINNKFAQDIDTSDDWILAEQKYKLFKLKND